LSRRSGGIPEPTVKSGWEKVPPRTSLTPRLDLGVFELLDEMRWTKLNTVMMRAAIEMANLGKGKTHPNPAVGAVIARGARVVAKGYHRRAGLPHAEIEALKSAGGRARGADLYVTLEPCNHYGKTPPCTEAIISSGIRRVFVATRDPNPLVNGKGIRHLRRVGIEVRVGLLAEEAMAVNETYFTYMRRGSPFVTLKIAQTIDGMIGVKSGESKWITSHSARAMARRLRSEAQALLVGIGTVLMDDPLLLPIPRRKSHYLRCILDSHLRLPLNSRIVRSAESYQTVVYCVNAPTVKRKRLERAGVVVKVVGHTGDGRVDINDVIGDLASQQVMHLIVEGGASTLSSFLKLQLFDRLILFVAPKIIGSLNGLNSFAELMVGDLERCYRVRFTDIRRIGGDIMIEVRREK